MCIYNGTLYSNKMTNYSHLWMNLTSIKEANREEGGGGGEEEKEQCIKYGSI